MKNFKQFIQEESLDELINVPKLWKKFKESNKNYAKAVLNYRKKIDGNIKKGKIATPAAVAAEIARTYDFDIRSFIRFLDQEVKLGNLDHKYTPGRVSKLGKFSADFHNNLRAESTDPELDRLGKQFRKACKDGDNKKAEALMARIDKKSGKYGTSPKMTKKTPKSKMTFPTNGKLKEDAPTNSTGASVPGSGDTGEAFGPKVKTYRCYDKRTNQLKKCPPMLKRPKEVKS